MQQFSFISIHIKYEIPNLIVIFCMVRFWRICIPLNNLTEPNMFRMSVFTLYTISFLEIRDQFRSSFRTLLVQHSLQCNNVCYHM